MVLVLRGHGVEGGLSNHGNKVTQKEIDQAIDIAKSARKTASAVSPTPEAEATFWRGHADTMLRYADEHLEDRVILTERMRRAQAAVEANDLTNAKRILAEKFYYFTDDCNLWDATEPAERRAKMTAVIEATK